MFSERIHSAVMVDCGISGIALKTPETAIMKVTNIALGWIAGREDRKKLLVTNFRERPKIRKKSV